MDNEDTNVTTEGNNADNQQQKSTESIFGKSIGTTIEQELQVFERGSPTLPKDDKPGEDDKTDGDSNKLLIPDDGKPQPKISDFSKVLPQAKKIVSDLNLKTSDDDKNKDKDKSDQSDDDNTTTDRNTPPKRDLTGFGEREAKWLQRMPIDAYEYFSKELKEKRNIGEVIKQKDAEITKLKEGKTTLPDSYYENPQAGWLNPEVQEMQGALNLASQIESHWKQQMINIEAGKDWFDLVEGKDGQIFIDNNAKKSGIPGDVEWATIKQNISGHYQHAINQVGRLRGDLNGLISNFQNKHKEFVGKIKNAEDTFMPMFKDEASEEYKKVTDVKAELTKFGISSHNPVLNMLSKSIALNIFLKDMLLAEKTKKDVTQRVNESQRRAGPTVSSTTGGGNNGVTQSPTLKDFAKLGLRSVI